MTVDDSVSCWLQGLQANDPEAARKLWERYFDRLARLAGRKLPAPGRAFDEEDVALSAFHSFFSGVAAGRFPQLDDRQDLWRVLLVITARKARTYWRDQTRQKRGGGKVGGESAFAPAGQESGAAGIEAVLGREPTPEFAAQVAEECGRLLALLPDEDYRAVAELKMQGHTINEIAARLASTRRTVQRKLDLIRKLWERELPPSE